MAERIPVTVVNHVAIDVACAPDVVWAAILAEYVEARKFREIGYAIDWLDEPAAFLGGYRLRFVQDGSVLDDRVCRVTELDAVARRLSMVADYRSVPGGMTVHATYHAQAAGAGTRLAIDCHSGLGIEPPADGSRAAVESAVATMTTQYAAALADYLQGLKVRLESEPRNDSLEKP